MMNEQRMTESTWLPSQIPALLLTGDAGPVAYLSVPVSRVNEDNYSII